MDAPRPSRSVQVTRACALGACAIYVVAMMAKAGVSAYGDPAGGFNSILNVNPVEVLGAFAMHAWAASPFLAFALLAWKTRSPLLLILALVVIVAAAIWGLNYYWYEHVTAAERARRGSTSLVIIVAPFCQWVSFTVVLLLAGAMAAWSSIVRGSDDTSR